MVSITMDPAGKGHGFSGIGGTKLSAIMRFVHITAFFPISQSPYYTPLWEKFENSWGSGVFTEAGSFQ